MEREGRQKIGIMRDGRREGKERAGDRERPLTFAEALRCVCAYLFALPWYSSPFHVYLSISWLWAQVLLGLATPHPTPPLQAGYLDNAPLLGTSI